VDGEEAPFGVAGGQVGERLLDLARVHQSGIEEPVRPLAQRVEPQERGEVGDDERVYPDGDLDTSGLEQGGADADARARVGDPVGCGLQETPRRGRGVTDSCSISGSTATTRPPGRVTRTSSATAASA
jgi:hypothetical protein